MQFVTEQPPSVPATQHTRSPAAPRFTQSDTQVVYQRPMQARCGGVMQQHCGALLQQQWVGFQGKAGWAATGIRAHYAQNMGEGLATAACARFPRITRPFTLAERWLGTTTMHRRSTVMNHTLREFRPHAHRLVCAQNTREASTQHACGTLGERQAAVRHTAASAATAAEAAHHHRRQRHDAPVAPPCVVRQEQREAHACRLN